MVPEENLKSKTVILTGPTASGKTSLAHELLSGRSDTEIINADSINIYRFLDIGSAKPTSQERQSIPHHLLDIRDPDQLYNAGEFVRDIKSTMGEIHSRQKKALIVGGTGFYLKALLFGLWGGDTSMTTADPAIRIELEKMNNDTLFNNLSSMDPASAKRIGQNDRYRLIRALEITKSTGKTPSELEAAMPDDPDPLFELWIIDRSSEELQQHIERRTNKMLEDGLIDEVRTIRQKFPNCRPLSSVGYAQVCVHLDHKSPKGRKVPMGIQGLISEINLATKQLVKRQRTWFKGQKYAKQFILDRDKDTLIKDFHEIYD